MQRRASNRTRDTPSTCFPTNVSLVEIGQQRALYLWCGNSFSSLTCLSLELGVLRENTWHTLCMFRKYCKFLISITPATAVGWIKHYTWHSPYVLRKHSRFGRNRAVRKRTFLQRPKKLFVSISPRNAAGWIKHHMSHSLYMIHNLC
jgi:hypothetical protein